MAYYVFPDEGMSERSRRSSAFQSPEERLVSLLAQAERFGKKAANFTRNGIRLRLKASELENPANPKGNADAAKKLRDNARKATIAGLHQFGRFTTVKKEIEICLLRFGERARPFREALEKLTFSLSAGAHPGVYGGEELGMLKGLREFEKLARVAVETISSWARSTPTHMPGPAGRRGIVAAEDRPGSYMSRRCSDADEELHGLIGPELIKSLTNAELWKDFGPDLRKKKPSGHKLKVTSFRVRLDRIRRHYGYPTSRRVKKIDREKCVPNNQRR